MRQFYWYKEVHIKPLHPPKGAVYGYSLAGACDAKHAPMLKNEPNTYVIIIPDHVKGGE
jgi:hypothetical protein